MKWCINRILLSTTSETFYTLYIIHGHLQICHEYHKYFFPTGSRISKCSIWQNSFFLDTLYMYFSKLLILLKLIVNTWISLPCCNTWICQSCSMYFTAALCQTKPSWSLTHVVQSSLKLLLRPVYRCWLSQSIQCLGSVEPLAIFTYCLLDFYVLVFFIPPTIQERKRHNTTLWMMWRTIQGGDGRVGTQGRIDRMEEQEWRGFWNTGEGPSIYYVIQNLGLQRHLKPLSLCIFLLSMLKKAFENVKKEKRKVKVVLA